jgi:hypothetical protein
MAVAGFTSILGLVAVTPTVCAGFMIFATQVARKFASAHRVPMRTSFEIPADPRALVNLTLQRRASYGESSGSVASREVGV